MSNPVFKVGDIVGLRVNEDPRCSIGSNNFWLILNKSKENNQVFYSVVNIKGRQGTVYNKETMEGFFFVRKATDEDKIKVAEIWTLNDSTMLRFYGP